MVLISVPQKSVSEKLGLQSLVLMGRGEHFERWDLMGGHLVTLGMLSKMLISTPALLLLGSLPLSW